MKISEERLKELVLRVLKELEAEERSEGRPEKGRKLYMVCASLWNEGYETLLNEMEGLKGYNIYPVIPASWQKQGYEGRLRSCKACAGILYRSCEKPADIDESVSLFPVVSRDVLVKTALCISDTFETSWIAACIEKGSRAVFLRSGLARFSGKEKPAYVNRIMEYYRQVLEYGIEICNLEEFAEGQGEEPAAFAGESVKPEDGSRCVGYMPQEPEKLFQWEQTLTSQAVSESRKKRVITASNVERFASGGIVYLQPDDIVTDLAKDRAKFLNILFK